MRIMIVIVLAALALSGCDAIRERLEPDRPAVDAAKTVFTSKVIYAAALKAAADYAKLPACRKPRQETPCKDPVVLTVLRKAEIAADAANQTAEDAAKNMSESKAVVEAATEAATRTTESFKKMTDAYVPNDTRKP